MHEIIFYNGFNLLVDIVIFSITAFFFYRAGNHKGFFEGMEAEALQQDYTRKATKWNYK